MLLTSEAWWGTPWYPNLSHPIGTPSIMEERQLVFYRQWAHPNAGWEMYGVSPSAVVISAGTSWSSCNSHDYDSFRKPHCHNDQGLVKNLRWHYSCLFSTVNMFGMFRSLIRCCPHGRMCERSGVSQQTQQDDKSWKLHRNCGEVWKAKVWKKTISKLEGSFGF